MKKLNEIFTIIATKAVEKGVVYLVNTYSKPQSFDPCIECMQPTSRRLCYGCRRKYAIPEWESNEYSVLAWAILNGVEVDIATGWPVGETVPCTNE